MVEVRLYTPSPQQILMAFKTKFPNATQSEIASTFDLTQPTINRILNGKNANARADTVDKMRAIALTHGLLIEETHDETTEPRTSDKQVNASLNEIRVPPESIGSILQDAATKIGRLAGVSHARIKLTLEIKPED